MAARGLQVSKNERCTSTLRWLLTMRTMPSLVTRLDYNQLTGARLKIDGRLLCVRSLVPLVPFAYDLPVNGHGCARA